MQICFEICNLNSNMFHVGKHKVGDPAANNPHIIPKTAEQIDDFNKHSMCCFPLTF